MFSLKTLIICAIYAAVLFFGRRLEISLAARSSNRPGLILPVIALIIAAALSVPNFIVAWDVSFSLVAFLAAVVLFVFYMIPALYFSLLYVEGRKEVRARKLARSKRMRQATTQQRVQPNLQRRYEGDFEKQDPIVYMPKQGTARAGRPETVNRPRAARNARTTTSRRSTSGRRR